MLASIVLVTVYGTKCVLTRDMFYVELLFNIQPICQSLQSSPSEQGKVYTLIFLSFKFWDSKSFSLMSLGNVVSSVMPGQELNVEGSTIMR